MPDPVVHFEVIGADPQRLRQYYGELFGWEFDTPSPVAAEVSDAEQYGFLDLVQSDDGSGIRGGIGGGAHFVRTRRVLRRCQRCRCRTRARRATWWQAGDGSGDLAERPRRRALP